MNYKQKIKSLENRIHRLNEIGIALSTESDTNKLFEMILKRQKVLQTLTGELYTVRMMMEILSLKYYVMIR